MFILLFGSVLEIFVQLLDIIHRVSEIQMCHCLCGTVCKICIYFNPRANKNVTLTLSWNVVPNAGILPLVMGSGHMSVPFPESYENPKSY